MTELGKFSLILAFFLTGYAILADIAGAWRKDNGLMRSARNAMLSCCLCLSVSMVVLWIKLIQCDFSISYVVQHTSLNLPLQYRISALWAGASGSLLLWLWLQMIMLAIVFFRTKSLKGLFCAHARAISNLVAVFFLLVLILDKNPFTPMDRIVQDGAGLNPLLQHPAMVLHPPILFIGYAAFAVPFAWAFACFKSTEFQSPLLTKTARNWALAAWLFLTAGIVLGAWWAYEELGWGGYWAWDPVENSSLMPWLTATALVHSFRIFAKQTRIVIWTEILCLLTFSLCIFGTFLTRYGLVSSVHAFPEPGLGILFIVLLIHIWVIAAILIIKRFYYNRKESASISSPPAQRFFIWNNWLFIFLTFVIMIGTLFPFLSGLVSEKKITLKPEYFTKITSPGGLILLLFIGLCPYLWKHGLKRTARFVIVSLAVVAIAVLWFIYKQLAMLFFIASGVLLINLIIDIVQMQKKKLFNLRSIGARIAHFGVLLMFIGIAGAGSGGDDFEKQTALIPGQKLQIGNFEIVYETLGADHGPNFTAMWAAISVYDQDRLIATMKPAKAVYSAGGKSVSEVDIRRTLASDLYMALMDVNVGNKMINLRIMIKPLINWIWIGSIILMTGAAMILLNFIKLSLAAETGENNG